MDLLIYLINKNSPKITNLMVFDNFNFAGGSDVEVVVDV